MRKGILPLLIIFLSSLLTGCLPQTDKSQESQVSSKKEKVVLQEGNKIQLPKPKFSGEMSLEEAILKRRSKREFLDKPLTLEQISQILWVAQGITDQKQGFRSTPSAGALYPLEVYLVVGQQKIEELEEGVYHYLPGEEQIEKILGGDFRDDLVKNCSNQNFIGKAPISLIIAADFSRTTVKYGERGEQYVFMEAGHAAQNIYLQVTALGLGTVTVGAFDEQALAETVKLPKQQTPLYVMPIGY